MIPNNVRTVRVTAAAGTNLARTSFEDRSNRQDDSPAFPSLRQRFTTRRPSSRTRRRSVRLAPIAEDSRLQPPVGVWAVFSPSEPGHALTPGTHRRLGGPLPHQQANRTRAHPQAELHLWSGDVIRYYRQFPAAIPGPGAGDPRVTLPFAAFRPLQADDFSRDLHA